ncbi:P-loop containing nucleoside triphosphate hydrolase protein [Syncephalis plumigaleata]|nr:P-loop containing nucleoside triphosphate hydrolase protein [Syncephalis plumigaleata]
MNSAHELQEYDSQREKPLPGLERAYKDLVEMVTYPLLYPQYFTRLNVQPPKGILLYGPPGVGKTHLVTQVASICRAKLLAIHGPSIYGAYIGESEAQLRAVFDEARDYCTTDPSQAVIIFIDELDVLTPHRNAAGTGGQESRVVAQLLTLMDGMTKSARWVIVAATNRPNAIDPALRRPGRFDRELGVDPPNECTRLDILKYLTNHLAISDDTSLRELAGQTTGYVGADLAALCRETINAAVQRKSQMGDASTTNNKRVELIKSDFVHALTKVTPSLLRSTQVDVAMTTWDSIGGLEEAKKQLRQAVEWPMLYPDTFRRLANTSNASFFTLSGAAIYSAYVGESERIVRELFHRARQSRPAVIFLDEVDAIVGKRELGSNGSSSSSGSSDPVRDRLLAALLNEMDGVETADSVLVVGATNRPDMLDAALLRPGRFDRQIYIPPPDNTARLQILSVHTRRVPLASSVSLDTIARKTDRYSGADLQNICREAALSALRRDRATQQVTMEDFNDALAIVRPSLSNDTLEWYNNYNAQTNRRSTITSM